MGFVEIYRIVSFGIREDDGVYLSFGLLRLVFATIPIRGQSGISKVIERSRILIDYLVRFYVILIKDDLH